VAERRRKYRDDFPSFAWHTNGAPPKFVEAVQQVVAGLDFQDRAVFPEWQADAYKAAKKYGKAVLMQPVGVNGIVQAASDALGWHLGRTVFPRLPNLERWIPFNDVQFSVGSRNIRVVFRSLLRAKGQGGTIYYSRHKPMVEIDGQKRIVGFSQHAIQRACDRVVPTWRTYTGLGDAFALFDQCIHFERAALHDGHLRFTFFAESAWGFHSGMYVQKVLGGWNGKRKGYYYRVGYCPAVVEGKFVKATTLLFPGQHSTPEYGLIGRSALPWREKERLREDARKLNMQHIRDTGDFSTTKWFHDNGIPQVIWTSDKYYMPPL
jgi:hypothetical protein